MVMKKKRKVATAAAATFGVAMASMYTAHDMSAEIIDITWNGGSPTASAAFQTYGGYGQDIDQIPNDVFSSVNGTIEIMQFFQWNDSFDSADGTARTMMLYYASVDGGPMSMEIANVGDVVDPATFVGRQIDGIAANIGQDASTTFNGTGSAFVVVRPREAPTNLYYFRVSFTENGPLVYSDGVYGSDGEALTIAGPTGPCPNAVGDLNGDGNIDLLDINGFVNSLLGDFVCEADINGDGVVDLLDVNPFVALILGN